MSKEELHEKALELFELVKEGNPSPDIIMWLEETAQRCMNHMAYLDELDEDEYSIEDVALLAVMEPYLFLLGVALYNHWLDRLDTEEH